MEIKGGNLVSQIKRLSDRILEQILAEKNIDAFNGAQGRILYVLWDKDGIALRELADKTGLAPTTLTSMVDRMEKAGLVCRVPDKNDRRKILLSLTDKARSLEQDYKMVSDKMTAIFYDGFTDEEIRECEAMLARILANMKKYETLRSVGKDDRL